MRADDELQFCWDDAKAASNLRKHGVSFEAATYVFEDPMRLELEDVFARGEYRNIAVGRVDRVILTVVYACPGEEVCRIISARLATTHERRAYEQNLS